MTPLPALSTCHQLPPPPPSPNRRSSRDTPGQRQRSLEQSLLLLLLSLSLSPFSLSAPSLSLSVLAHKRYGRATAQFNFSVFRPISSVPESKSCAKRAESTQHTRAHPRLTAPPPIKHNEARFPQRIADLPRTFNLNAFSRQNFLPSKLEVHFFSAPRVSSPSPPSSPTLALSAKGTRFAARGTTRGRNRPRQTTRRAALHRSTFTSAGIRSLDRLDRLRTSAASTRRTTRTHALQRKSGALGRGAVV